MQELAADASVDPPVEPGLNCMRLRHTSLQDWIGMATPQKSLAMVRASCHTLTLLGWVRLGSELPDASLSQEHALWQDGDSGLFTCKRCSMVGPKEDLLALPCTPVAPSQKRALPGLVHTTQENINRFFGVAGVGKRCRKDQGSAVAEGPVTPPAADAADDNLGLALMEEELAVLLAHQRELEEEEQRQKVEDEQLLELLAEQQLLAALQEEEKLLQEALLQSIEDGKGGPRAEMPPPPVPQKHKSAVPTEKKPPSNSKV